MSVAIASSSPTGAAQPRSEMSAVEDPATCAALHELRLRHVDLALRVDMSARAIVGVAELRLERMNSLTSVWSLRLDVFHLRINSVKAEVPPTGKGEEEGGAEPSLAPVEWSVKPFTAFGEALEIALPEALVTLETTALRLVIDYETQPDSPGVCWLDKQQTAGKRLPYMYTQGQEVLNRSLFPCQDSPSVRITYSASVIVPEHFVCVMSARQGGEKPLLDDEGRVTGRQFSFEMTQSIPVYLVAMAVGDLVSAEIGPRSKIWTEPCMLEAATNEFDGVVERYISIGEQLFGEYQWEQYDVLVMPPSFPYGGMENPRLTFVSPCNVAGDQSLVSVIAHEISHSWFGNLVTNATWSDFFLNEGFTMYAERRITEVAHGRSLMCLNAKLGEALLREEISSLGEDSPLTRLRVPLEQGIDPGDCYNHCAYEKGYDFVCYLRKLAGSDEAFDGFLRRYCERFRFQSIPAEDMMAFFLECFPHHADKSELKGDISFHEWLNAPGYPRYVPDLSDAQDVMESCETLAFYWRSSSAPVQANVLYLTKEAKSWEVFQLLYFLDCCFEATFADPDVVIALGDALSLWHSKNSEVLFRWAQVLIKNEVLSKLNTVGAFLKMQGKQKFQIPLFRLLTGSPNQAIRQLAIDLYAECKSFLHVMVRGRIEALLDSRLAN